MKVGRIEQLTHTPGPWRVERPQDGLVKFKHHVLGERPTVSIWADGKHAAGGFYHEVALVADNDEANAQLIAAAPDLLAALKEVNAALGDERIADVWPTMPDWYPRVLAAIAKAEGR